MTEQALLHLGTPMPQLLHCLSCSNAFTSILGKLAAIAPAAALTEVAASHLDTVCGTLQGCRRLLSCAGPAKQPGAW